MSNIVDGWGVGFWHATVQDSMHILFVLKNITEKHEWIHENYSEGKKKNPNYKITILQNYSSAVLIIFLLFLFWNSMRNQLYI